MKTKRLFSIFCLFISIFYGCNESIKESGIESVDAVEFENDRVVIPENEAIGYVPIFLSVYATEDIEVTVKALKKDASDWAKEDTNFILPEKMIIIPKGASSVKIPVVPINDTIVNKDRQFDLWIQAVKGASKSKLSQTCRVVIGNDDKWPEISFNAAFTQTTEHDTRLVVPVKASGVFYNPATVSYRVVSHTAVEGTDFEVTGDDRTFIFDKQHTQDSIVIRILNGDVSKDMDFELVLDTDIQHGAVTGKFKSTKVIIRNVVKTIGFAKAEYLMLKGMKSLRVPVYVQGVSSPRDVTAAVMIDSYGGGLGRGDIILAQEQIVTKGNDTVYLDLSVKPGIELTDGKSVRLKLSDVTGATLNEGMEAASVVVKVAPEITRGKWGIVSCSSQSGTAESAANIIDDDPKTFWQSKWSKPAEGEEIPFTIVIDMNEVQSVEAVEINRNNGYIPRLKLYISDDKTNWSMMKECEFGSSVFTQKFEFNELFTGRYLKIFVEESTEGNKAARIGDLKAFGLKQNPY